MSSQLERDQEVRQEERVRKLGRIVDYELEGAVGHAGGLLLGFSVRISPEDCLVTLRAVVAGRNQVAFVGGSTLASALFKATTLARTDKLEWRQSKYS